MMHTLLNSIWRLNLVASVVLELPLLLLAEQCDKLLLEDSLACELQVGRLEQLMEPDRVQELGRIRCAFNGLGIGLFGLPLPRRFVLVQYGHDHTEVHFAQLEDCRQYCGGPPVFAGLQRELQQVEMR